MISGLIDRFKQKRKQNWLNMTKSLSGKYAFIGVGSHSLSNLYPVLDFRGLGLKYIHSRTIKNAEDLAVRYPQCEGTDDLEKILQDPEIEGVFICTHPKAHFEYTKRAIEAGKHVFVEKPPCSNKAELEELVKASKGKTTLVGFQKVYGKLAEALRNVKNPVSYSYKYHTGAYPEGDPVLDLFSHPVSLVIALFGEVKDLQITKTEGTWLLQLNHSSGVKGQMSLSVDYDWSSAVEEVEVNSKEHVYKSTSPYQLIRQKHTRKVLGVPLEKALKQSISIEKVFEVNGFVPLAENNSLFVQGYAQELDAFIKLSAGQKADNYSDLEFCKKVFTVLDKIR